MPAKIIEDTYLGDGVYASFDGRQIWLDLRAQDDTTRIALDPEVFENLNKFNLRIKEALSRTDDTTPEMTSDEAKEEMNEILRRMGHRGPNQSG